MTPSLSPGSRLGGAPLRRAAIALSLVVVAAGCGSKAAAPTPAPTPAAAPATPSWLTCPDPTDGSSIIADKVNEAHRAFVANRDAQVPPPCLFTAFARVVGSMPDSLNTQALALAAESRRRGPERAELLAAEIVLLARARRYADVSQTYTRLVAIDSQPAIEVSRLAIAAARQRADTATLVRLLNRTMSQPGAGPAMRAEANILRQVGALWQAINEARGLVRQNPRNVTAYPSLVGNFGTLGLGDSVVAMVRRGLAAGATRASLAPSIETIVSAMLRHAALYGSTYGWEAPIATATRVDSAMTAPSTKFLVASLIVLAAEPRLAEISELVPMTGMTPANDAAAAQRKTTGCQRLPAVATSLNTAEAKLREGGDRFAGGGVPQVTAGLSAVRSKVAELQVRCGTR